MAALVCNDFLKIPIPFSCGNLPTAKKQKYFTFSLIYFKTEVF